MPVDKKSWSRLREDIIDNSIKKCGIGNALDDSEDYLIYEVSLGGLRVTCSPRDPRFAGSNPAEVDGFFQDIKILSTSSLGGTLSWGSRV